MLYRQVKDQQIIETGKGIVMRAISSIATALAVTATQAMAAGGTPEGEGIGILAACFIGFGVMIIMFQFIPGIMLMVGMIKGLFSLGQKEAKETPAGK